MSTLSVEDNMPSGVGALYALLKKQPHIAEIHELNLPVGGTQLSAADRLERKYLSLIGNPGNRNFTNAFLGKRLEEFNAQCSRIAKSYARPQAAS